MDIAKESTTPEVSPEEYEERLPHLRTELVQAQIKLSKSKISVIVVICGVDGAGKGEVIHRLNEWLDPRGIDTQAFWDLSQEATERPPHWKFWDALPRKGRLGLFFGGWYSDPIINLAYGKIKTPQFEKALNRIQKLETMLAADDVLFVKFWFHLTKNTQFEKLQDLYKNPLTHWRVIQTDWKHHELYEDFTHSASLAMEATQFPHAPWHSVDCTSTLSRDLTTGEILLSSIQKKLSDPSKFKPKDQLAGYTNHLPAKPDKPLSKIEFEDVPKEKKSKKVLVKYQSEFNSLVWEAYRKQISTVAVFEGWDAAGKGGCIRRVTQAMDARLYRLIPVAAPSQLEKTYHYLWRFWRHIPRAGRVAIFDRSWYGRVMVERVEGFATQEEWTRAYEEINDFERQLTEHGILVLKFWLHITPEEQLSRFQKREEVPYKRYKITDEDWRNREKWDQYEEAVNQMIIETDRKDAPWHLIPANDKKAARVQILRTMIKAMKKRF